MTAAALVATLLMISGASARSEAAPAASAPVLTVAAIEKTMIVDAFAVNREGTALAYVLVTSPFTGPRVATLKIVAIPNGSELSSVTGIPLPQQLAWVGDDRVLAIEAVGKRHRVWTIPTAGPAPQTSLGPVDHAALEDLAGTATVVTYTRTAHGDDVVHKVATFSPIDLHPLADATWTETHGRIDQADGKLWPLWWSDGWSVLVGRRAGAYDKAKDIRLPQQLVRLDALTGVARAEPLPVDGFARVTAEHRVRQGAHAFVFERRGTFELVAGGVMRPITLARRARDYYTGSLHDQAVANGKLLVSATSRRKANDPDGIEFYTVDLAAGAPVQALVVPGLQQFVTWHAAGSRVAVLRERKGAHSGPAIDVYDLAIK
ncbi:MAG: hypothetical protein ABI467_00070 [Kofleriaceae bacterium]